MNPRCYDSTNYLHVTKARNKLRFVYSGSASRSYGLGNLKTHSLQMAVLYPRPRVMAILARVKEISRQMRGERKSSSDDSWAARTLQMVRVMVRRARSTYNATGTTLMSSSRPQTRPRKASELAVDRLETVVHTVSLSLLPSNMFM